jgi:hypothetical protein
VNSVEAVWQVAIAVMLSLGGGAALVVGFSSWLGKIWADRIATSERARFTKELEGYKSELQHLLEDRRDALSRKRDVYAKLVTSMRVFIGGRRNVSDDEKRAFLEAFDHASLWASEEVTEQLAHFLEISVRITNQAGSISNDEFKNAYRACVVAIRRDCGFPETKFTYPVVQFD